MKQVFKRKGRSKKWNKSLWKSSGYPETTEDALRHFDRKVNRFFNVPKTFKNDQGAAKAYLGNANFQKFKVILKNCALHIIKINNISIKNLYLDDQELGLEVMKNYLQSMDTFDPEYKTALNNMPLSKDIVQFSRRYNAPYWANSLKIYF